MPLSAIRDLLHFLILLFGLQSFSSEDLFRNNLWWVRKTYFLVCTNRIWQQVGCESINQWILVTINLPFFAGPFLIKLIDIEYLDLSSKMGTKTGWWCGDPTLRINLFSRLSHINLSPTHFCWIVQISQREKPTLNSITVSSNDLNFTVL